MRHRNQSQDTGQPRKEKGQSRGRGGFWGKNRTLRGLDGATLTTPWWAAPVTNSRTQSLALLAPQVPFDISRASRAQRDWAGRKSGTKGCPHHSAPYPGTPTASWHLPPRLSSPFDSKPGNSWATRPRQSGHRVSGKLRHGGRCFIEIYPPHSQS